ncbi:MAG TPA: exodeoxyribonuclease VII large subunit [Candidatus Caccovicinus merdipullorum]|uniref:Exodeoxyribonuclease 7 large subunit n=1 Tax=Candidatus Caccovicinus merdipullorum TaxID=2840724 RepID=A0A9D1KG46_9FIRM|nr:exodeoxyribonuclease VII large subunit [Candidatus Caccovicinus merdipullorum]
MAGVYTVSQVNAYIKNMFVQDYALSRISIKGEVSNVKYHTSGHIYFTLKDGKGALSAVMFASQRMGLSFPLKEGQQVVATGSVDVYERDGKYQLYAREIRLDGMGALFMEFVRLRNELQEMGMFSEEYKQPIPRYAKTVGIVTAPTGAAVRDIMNISQRRNPYVQLILYPALVQGKGAKESIVKGIRTLDAMGLDVLIVGRGGGSIEDLWAFNEEEVAQAIFECATPVISAVGHETDVTIADYVADLRAPTPSAAAELAVFDYRQFQADLGGLREAMVQAEVRRLAGEKGRLEQYRLRLKVKDPIRQLNDRRMRIMKLEEDLEEAVRKKLLDRKHRLEILAGRLQGLSPLEKISGGYGFLMDGQGKRVVSVSQIKPGDALEIRVRDGRIQARAEAAERFSDF